MGNRIVLIDGVEATGKTTLIEKLKKKKPFWKFIACPGDEIMQKFHEEMKSENFEQSKIYINALVEKIYKTFAGSDFDTLVFDRGMFSTLVYQGRTSEKTIRYIFEAYNNLYQRLNIDFEESCAILMTDVINKRDSDKIPEKLCFTGNPEQFRKVAEDPRQPFPFYNFSIREGKPSWLDTNDLAGEVIDVYYNKG